MEVPNIPLEYFLSLLLWSNPILNLKNTLTQGLFLEKSWLMKITHYTQFYIKIITFFDIVMLHWTLFFMKILHLGQNIYFESVYNQILECAKKFRPCLQYEKDDNLSPRPANRRQPTSDV